MALAWLLKDERVTSVLIGASSVAQLMDNLKALDNISFSGEELQEIEIFLIYRESYPIVETWRAPSLQPVLIF